MRFTPRSPRVVQAAQRAPRALEGPRRAWGNSKACDKAPIGSQRGRHWVLPLPAAAAPCASPCPLFPRSPFALGLPAGCASCWSAFTCDDCGRACGRQRYAVRQDCGEGRWYRGARSCVLQTGLLVVVRRSLSSLPQLLQRRGNCGQCACSMAMLLALTGLMPC